MDEAFVLLLLFVLVCYGFEASPPPPSPNTRGFKSKKISIETLLTKCFLPNKSSINVLR